MSKKILVASVALMITRDAMTILPSTVAAHEVDVMKAVHGEENVRVLDDPTEPVEIEAAVEVERLEQRYGGGEGSPLERAYGTNYKFSIPKALQEHIVQATAADEGSGSAAGGTTAGGAKALDAMTKAELLAEAEKRGVKADASMNKAAILEAIETANLV